MHLQNSNLFNFNQKSITPPRSREDQHNEEDIFYNCGDSLIVVPMKIFYKNPKINSIKRWMNGSIKKFQLAIVVHTNADHKPQSSQTSYATLSHDHLQLHTFPSILQLCTCTSHMQYLKKKFYMCSYKYQYLNHMDYALIFIAYESITHITYSLTMKIKHEDNLARMNKYSLLDVCINHVLMMSILDVEIQVQNKVIVSDFCKEASTCFRVFF